MGLFDRFTSKKPAPSPTAGASAAGEATPATAAAGGVKPRLAAAREKLDAKDLPGAVAIYEEVLTAAGDRADVLVAISGDLGSHGHVAQIIELVAPRYDAERHGPATGINLLQAYLAVRDADAAQHVLDILFALNRPELEDRLHGFSNVIAEILAEPSTPVAGLPAAPGAEAPQVALISISKPIRFYGLEPMAAQLLPPKESRLRRIAFAQLALPGYPEIADAIQKPEDELGRFSRALPLWFAETFYFSASYAPIAVVGMLTPPGQTSRPVLFGAEWSTENLRQLVETTSEGVDYIITGALKVAAGDYELLLRVWEVKTFRERKTFTARWTPATADAALTQLHGEVRRYMEWSPASAAFAYSPPAHPLVWLDTLGASLGAFLADKGILAREFLRPLGPDLATVGDRAASGEAAAFAYLTLRARAAKLGLEGAAAPEPALARSPLVNDARKAIP